MTLPTLPYDIIFDCVAFAAVIPPWNSILPSDYECLRNLSLVSKQVSIYAQKALFRTVLLKRSSDCIAFGIALDRRTEKGRWLANMVTTLEIEVHGRLTQRLFTAALLACPKLRELELCVNATSFDVSSFVFDCISRVPPIQSLRIAASPDVSAEFLNVFPSVKFVEFKNNGNPSVLPDNAPACTLVELHWRGHSINDSLIWILQNSTGVLEVLASPLLDPSYKPNYKLFGHLMCTHGPSLRSLHIPSLPDSEMTSLQRCTQLKELILDGMTSEVALGFLPETIEHLQIQVLLDFEPQLWTHVVQFLSRLTHWIETSPPPSLLTFTWVHDDFPGPTRVLGRLQKACYRRGIVWRDWRLPFGTYPGERQELGYGDTFPRSLQLSPLRITTPGRTPI